MQMSVNNWFASLFVSSMHILLALLYASLVAAPECLCLSAKGDFIINTPHVIIIAKTTLIHINTLRRSVRTLDDLYKDIFSTTESLSFKERAEWASFSASLSKKR